MPLSTVEHRTELMEDWGAMSEQAITEPDSTAGVKPAAPWRLKSLSVLPGYRLAVIFQDGRSGVVDCSGVTSAKNCGVFAALADATFFEKVSLELGVATWPNEADIDPAWMHEMLGKDKSWSVPF
jgi:hypothetical protein